MACRIFHVLGPHCISGFIAPTLPFCSLCSRLTDPLNVPWPRQVQRIQSLPLLEHFFHTFPAFSFSSTDLRSNENYQRHFLTTPYKAPFSIFPLPLRIFSSEHFLPFLILHVCLLSLSHHKNVRSEDQGPLSGECDSEAGNSVMGWSLRGGCNCTLASCGFTEGS